MNKHKPSRMEIHAVTRKTCTTEPEAVHDHLPTPRPPSRPCASRPLLSSNLASSSSKARPAECKARVKPAPEVAFGSEGPETSSRGWIVADMVPKLLSGDLGASDRMHTALTWPTEAELSHRADFISVQQSALWIRRGKHATECAGKKPATSTWT